MQAAIINDTHEQPETLKQLFTQLADAPGDLLFWNGDMFNDIATEQQLAEQLLYPAGMAYAASRPVCFARGNHDVRGAEARALGRILDSPAGHYYYTLRQGPVAFIVLDTGEDKPDDAPVYAGLGTFDAYRTRQAAWLATALAQPEVRDAAFRVVVVHIPLYGEQPVRFHGGADARDKWHAHLVKGRVDLMVTGHTHRHAWLPPDATRPFGQLRGGGPQPAGATLIRLDADAQRLVARLSRLDGTLISEHVMTKR
jgi:predicted phosphodiesterase